jgi:hypothetical protein
MELPSRQPGFWKIFQGPLNSGWYYAYNCPCGCKYPGINRLMKAGEPPSSALVASVSWDWDGNLQAPTLTPSFKRHTPCATHFEFKNGIYICHPDGAPKHPNCWRP